MRHTNNPKTLKEGIYMAGNTCYIVLNSGVEHFEGLINASPHLFEGEELLLESNDLSFLRKSLPILIKAIEDKNKQKRALQCDNAQYQKISQTKPKCTEKNNEEYRKLRRAENREIRRAKALINLSIGMPYGADGSNAFNDALGD